MLVTDFRLKHTTMALMTVFLNRNSTTSELSLLIGLVYAFSGARTSTILELQESNCFGFASSQDLRDSGPGPESPKSRREVPFRKSYSDVP